MKSDQDSAQRWSSSGELTLVGLVVVSGASALILQTVFIRALAIILGNSLYAFSCVVTTFILGLSVGAALIELVRIRFPKAVLGRELQLYAACEFLVGLYGLAMIPFIFGFQEWLIVALQQLSQACGASWSAVLLSFALLAIPTMFMGATIPVLASYVPQSTQLNRLYYANTYGAVLGVAVANGFVIPWFGCNAAVIMVFALNLGCALISWRLPRIAPGSTARRVALSAQSESFVPRHEIIPMLGLAFFSGFVFLAAEVLWTRRLGLILGNRVYVTAVTLAIVLLGIAIGSQLAGLLGRRFPTRTLLAWSYGVAAILFVVEPWLVKLLLERKAGAYSLLHVGRPISLAFISTAAIIGTSATLMGIAFPTLLLNVKSRFPVAGRAVGSLLAVNTIGGALGALAGSFLLLRFLGSDASFLALGMCLSIATLLFGTSLVSARNLGIRSLGYTAAFLVAVFGALAVNHLRKATSSPYFDSADIVALKEDEHGLFQIAKLGDHLRVFNNSSELVYRLGSPTTQFVQEMQAHLPMLYCPGAKSVANIGTGYGITAGAFTLYPQIETIDTVEIVPALFEHAHLFATCNYSYFDDRRVSRHATDGRGFLALSHETFDIISINVTDPYTPGSSSFFSTEFYELCDRHLAPGGVVCQHLFGPDIHTLIHNLRRHFPHLRAVPSYDNGLNIVASKCELSEPDWNAPYALPAVRGALTGCGATSPRILKGLVSRGNRDVDHLLKQRPHFTNTDSHPVLEYRMVRGSVGLWHSNM